MHWFVKIGAFFREQEKRYGLIKIDDMVVAMVQDDVSTQVEAYYNEANKARERGDMDGFFDYSHKALEVVKRWIDRQQCRMSFKESFESSICRVKDEQDLRIAFNYLKLSVLRVEVGMGEPKLDLRELNKHLLNKAI